MRDWQGYLRRKQEEHGDVFKTNLFGKNTNIVLQPALAKQLLTQYDGTGQMVCLPTAERCKRSSFA